MAHKPPLWLADIITHFEGVSFYLEHPFPVALLQHPLPASEATATEIAQFLQPHHFWSIVFVASNNISWTFESPESFLQFLDNNRQISCCYERTVAPTVSCIEKFLRNRCSIAC